MIYAMQIQVKPVVTEEIKEIKDKITSLFPSLDVETVTKAQAMKCTAFTSFLDKHCRQRQYMFQVSSYF